jgi:hypothetical protein
MEEAGFELITRYTLIRRIILLVPTFQNVLSTPYMVGFMRPCQVEDLSIDMVVHLVGLCACRPPPDIYACTDELLIRIDSFLLERDDLQQYFV